MIKQWICIHLVSQTQVTVTSGFGNAWKNVASHSHKLLAFCSLSWRRIPAQDYLYVFIWTDKKQGATQQNMKARLKWVCILLRRDIISSGWLTVLFFLQTKMNSVLDRIHHLLACRWSLLMTVRVEKGFTKTIQRNWFLINLWWKIVSAEAYDII